jgi:indole-3-glycerol phosphate synthase
MARSSAVRVEAARQRESFGELERRARAAPPAPGLRLSAAGFDVIAELKLRSPAAGRLSDPAHDWPARVADYARGGAAAVSVLTEPSRFDGSLDHLRQAAAVLKPLGIPAMRKDFLVDPYQVLEARAAGAGGVLVILRMLSADRLTRLMDAAAEHGLFVLLEAFDAADLEVARRLLSSRRTGPTPPAVSTAPTPSTGSPTAPTTLTAPAAPTVLIGVNCRDLQSLDVVQRRFAELAPLLPPDAAAVAESGVATPADAVAVRRLGYRLALIGTALMARDEPQALLGEILHSARTLGG